MNRIGRWRESLGKTVHDLEDEELQADASRIGATPIAELPEREQVQVCGTVRAVTLPPLRSVPMLVVEIYDGTTPLNLVWLGRRQIRGIGTGTYLTARGRVTRVKGVRTIYNPSYTIRPHRGG